MAPTDPPAPNGSSTGSPSSSPRWSPPFPVPGPSATTPSASPYFPSTHRPATRPSPRTSSPGGASGMSRDDLLRCAQAFRDESTGLIDDVGRQLEKLAALGVFMGDDDAGRDFKKGYEEAAVKTVNAVNVLASVFSTLAHEGGGLLVPPVENPGRPPKPPGRGVLGIAERLEGMVENNKAADWGSALPHVDPPAGAPASGKDARPPR